MIEQVLELAGVTLNDIDWLIPHQTSVRAIRSGERALAESSGQRPKHIVVTVDDLGNTASTTLFIALHRYLSDHQLHVGDKVLLLSLASGLEIGIVLFIVDELETSHGNVH